MKTNQRSPTLKYIYLKKVSNVPVRPVNSWKSSKRDRVFADSNIELFDH